MWSSTPAIFIFANPVPSLAPLALYQHQRGACPDVARQLVAAQAARTPGADLGETFYQVSPHVEELFSDGSADLGERYRYCYDAAADLLVVLRRKSPDDNKPAYQRHGGRGIGMPPKAPLGPWREEFRGPLTDFVDAY